jgi:hypothetical protein
MKGVFRLLLDTIGGLLFFFICWLWVVLLWAIIG